jgi:hypothetical protein
VSDRRAAKVKGGETGVKRIGEILSSVSKARTEISQTFARNVRA